MLYRCRDFIYVTDRTYSRDEILTMEGLMLAKLSFHLSPPHAYVFLERLSQVAP